MARYCQDWNPDELCRKARNWAYSLGVSVVSTPHCSISVCWMCLTRARPFRAGDELVGAQLLADGPKLVQHELEPQLGGLVLDDEEQSRRAGAGR